MTSEETAQTMLEKVKEAKGVLIVYANYATWIFKNGKFLNYHDAFIPTTVLDDLGIKYKSLCFDYNQDEASQIFYSSLNKRGGI